MLLKKLFFVFVALLMLSFSFSCKEGADDDLRQYTVTFDAKGGSPAPDAQIVNTGGLATEPAIEPTKGDSIFVGWYTSSNMKFNFKSNPVNMNITLHAKWWGGPDQYVFINAYDWEYNYEKINSYFGSSKGKSVAIGTGILIYCFERSSATLEEELRKHLELSEELEVPVLVELDAITFMTARPDLWNWWDPSQPGYNPDNKNNVEWTSWSSDDAVKIGWLNWGQQIRLNPMPNLMSPVYRQAVNDEMTHLITIVAEWYQNLSSDKKYLFGGIKVTGEMAIGVNNWYYPNGNSYIDQDTANDPQTGINIYDTPGRGVQTIGYAALKTGGIKSSGNITGDDIAELARLHSEFVSKLCVDLGIPRDHIFSHAGGVEKDLEACINQYACPSWSFYNEDATNPSGYTAALSILDTSDAPYFGIAEWSIGDSQYASKWKEAIQNGLSIPRCRFLSIFANVIGNDYYGTDPNLAAIEGINDIQ